MLSIPAYFGIFAFGIIAAMLIEYLFNKSKLPGAIAYPAQFVLTFISMYALITAGLLLAGFKSINPVLGLPTLIALIMGVARMFSMRSTRSLFSRDTSRG